MSIRTAFTKKARPLFMKDRSQQSLNRVGYLSEVNDYLSSHCKLDENDTLTFWKRNKERCPTLSKLASIYLPIPASSGPVERIFSIGGKYLGLIDVHWGTKHLKT